MALWQRIYSELDAKLDVGGYAVGDLFATVGSVAEKYGVSNITASRALQELSKKGRVKNVPHKGCVVSSKPMSIDVYFVPAEQVAQASIPLANMQKGIFIEAASLGVDIKTIAYDDLLKLPRTRRGIVLFLNYANFIPTEALISMLPPNLLPVVVGAYSEYSVMTRGVFICRDFLEMGRQIVYGFHKAGCRRIGYFGKCYGDCFFPRFEGYMEGIRKFGLELSMSDVFPFSGDIVIKEEDVRAWFASGGFDAIFSSNIELHYFLKRCLNDVGVALPKHVATIGLYPVNDKSVDVYCADYEAMGRVAVKLLAELDDKAFGKGYRHIYKLPFESDFSEK